MLNYFKTIHEGPAAVILEGINQTENYLGSYEDNYIDAIKENPKYSFYFRDINLGNYHFALSFFDFVQIFDVIYYSNFNVEKKYNYRTLCKERPNSITKFSVNSYLIFRNIVSVLKPI